MVKKNKHLLLIILLVSAGVFSAQAQELFFTIGKNFTRYDYRNSMGMANPNVKASSGNAFSVGYLKGFSDCRCAWAPVSYGAEFTLNEYNAIGDNSGMAYEWKTSYLGLLPAAYFSFFPNENFDIAAKLGANFSTIVLGQQRLGPDYFNITSNKEFSGIWVAPTLGLNFKYAPSSLGYMSLGYSYAKSFKLSHSSPEKLAFINHNVQFAIHYTF